MKYNKIFITGAGGMLGSYIEDSFQDSKLILTDINIDKDLGYCDVGKPCQVQALLEVHRPDLIINLAAMTDLEICEKEYVNCLDSNYHGCVNLYKMANWLEVPYVFISTAGVFDGKKEFYDDDDKQNPLGVYAKSKHLSELYLQQSNFNKTWVFRAGWMMGGGIAKDNKFVNKFMKQIRDGKKEIHVVDDKLGTPTYCKDFAESIKRHLDEDLPFGLYNMVSKGSASRYDVAIKIKQLLDLDVDIIKVDSNFFKQEYFAERPASEKLVNSKLNLLERNYMRHWELALTDYIRNDYK